ncbi:FGFR1 oncogene partner 2 homolog [Anopheles arabiensis]|uniref:AGAP012118-PA n=2 Tax=gambiae species complex TaxID=44542 RepID=Q7PZW4_ANOGA|nr:FGFR1 oncogene partner 2 homolog [Anopheles arabiensis]XP_061518464.1 FGFR1 oncogene partner 2 homolog [Anopheles gambiae]EAA00216.3 AGAP012118-PA [Anopheles gambiae str. PEST]
MSVTFEQIILDAKRIANRLKDREALGDALLLESESVNKHIESMRQFQDDIDILNKLARDRSNNQLITIIHQENPQIREIQQENRLLKAALEDHQHALEHIMSKYREHTQAKILNTKVNFVEAFTRHHRSADIERRDELIRQQTAKIQEMAAVMQRVSQIDEEKMNQEQEVLSKLVTENKGLRELLEISRKYGSGGQKMLVDDKSTQTDSYLLDGLIEAAVTARANLAKQTTVAASATSTSLASPQPSTVVAPASPGASATVSADAAGTTTPKATKTTNDDAARSPNSSNNAPADSNGLPPPASSSPPAPTSSLTPTASSTTAPATPSTS